jgi:hypothetical protein
VLRILQDSFGLTIGEATAYRYLNTIPQAVIDVVAKKTTQ